MEDAPVTVDTLLRAAAGHLEGGRLEAAIEAYEAALRLRPVMPNSWYNLALLQRRAGRFDAALASYDRALAFGVEGPEEVHLNRGVIFSDDLARPHLALAELQASLRIAPDYVPALINLGNLHQDRGEADAARAAYQDACRLAPGAATPLARLLGVSSLSGAGDPLAKAAQARIAAADGSPEERAEIGYALAGALDRAGAWEAAFAAAAAANADARRLSQVSYDPAAQERFVDRTIAAFSAPPADDHPAPGRAAPIFIVGMFRSGSTLAEQILVQGEGVTAGGELEIVPMLLGGMTPEAVAAASPAEIARLRRTYLERLHAARGAEPFQTDKRPDNFLHIGFIKRLFPEARIVHTVRRPEDVAVSLFFLHLDPAMAYATSLADIGHWYRQYERLMAHWESLWPGDIHRLDYDALVAAPRAEIEALFRFTGIPHDSSALDYRGSHEAVRTASAGQVHEPLYTRASGRSRHYARHLSPFLGSLRG